MPYVKFNNFHIYKNGNYFNAFKIPAKINDQ